MVEDQDLRKTARGASSPAKPALHIPELHGLSVASSTVCYLRVSRISVAEGSISIPTATARLVSRLILGNVGAYPLSMTRAATSSVDSKEYQ